MTRPIWSGNLQISLVSFGVGLIPATDPAGEVSFHQVDRKTGQRVHHQKVVNDDSVEQADIVKGYEIGKGKYIAIEPQEIKDLRIESKSTLEIQQFVALEEIPLELFEKPYFVVPEPADQTTAYSVILRALEQTGKAGLGEIAFAGREHLVAIAPVREKDVHGLMAYTLRYGRELRNASEYFVPVQNGALDKKQLAMAIDLMGHYSGKLDLSAFKDDYEVALRKLIDAKMKNMPLPLEAEKTPRGKVINLADALRKSLGNAQKQDGKSKPPARASAGRKGAGTVKSARRNSRVA
jgi:DNA end-binding protein Ku